MSNVLIVTNRESLNSPFEGEPPGTINCTVIPPKDVESMFSVPAYSRPDLMVVDIASVQPPADGFVDRLSRMNPEASIIILALETFEISAIISSHFAVDEVIRFSTDDRRMRITRRELTKKIALFDRLHGVQEKLEKEMHQQHLVVRSESMRGIISCLPQLAGSLSTVLITGETGTGKELIARAIHYLGPRCGRPFITVDCGTIPEHLVENELFGHARGAYTDAGGGFKGLIREADGGTLFLDEVESLPLSVQTKLLRFLQERQYKPLGQSNYVSVDVHVLAATNVDLAKYVERKLFREDLYYRLKVIPVAIPPLRERKEDIPKLVRYFLRRYGVDGSEEADVPSSLLQRWIEYDWPGNVRELENKVQEWLMKASTGSPLESPLPYETFATHYTLSDVRREALARCEEKYFRQIMTVTAGNISASARLAGIDRKNLRRLLNKYGIDPNTFRMR